MAYKHRCTYNIPTSSLSLFSPSMPSVTQQSSNLIYDGKVLLLVLFEFVTRKTIFFHLDQAVYMWMALDHQSQKLTAASAESTRLQHQLRACYDTAVFWRRWRTERSKIQAKLMTIIWILTPPTKKQLFQASHKKSIIHVPEFVMWLWK